MSPNLDGPWQVWIVVILMSILAWGIWGGIEFILR